MALLVVDPQRDFCASDGAIARRFGFDMSAIQGAVVRLNSLIGAARAAGVMIVWVRGAASDLRMFPNQKSRRGSGDTIWLIREGSPGADWYEGVTRPKEGEPVVTKDTYDAFAYTDLDLILRAHGKTRLIIAGFTTNVCVESAARSAFTRGYYVTVAADCSGAPTESEHASALHNIATYFGDVTDSRSLVDSW